MTRSGSGWWASAVGLTVGAALLWTVLAALRPTTTWHLGPFLVAAAAPWSWSRLGDGPVGPRAAATAAGTGWLAGLVTTGVLAGLGLLRGPTFTGTGDTVSAVVVEAAVMATAGASLPALVGLVRARGPLPGGSRGEGERADV